VGTPALSAGFINNLIAGVPVVSGNTFSGSATGKRYAIDTNSVALVGGAGQAICWGCAGTAASGAQYASLIAYLADCGAKAIRSVRWSCRASLGNQGSAKRKPFQKSRSHCRDVRGG
jgi:hypothetical protein